MPVVAGKRTTRSQRIDRRWTSSAYCKKKCAAGSEVNYIQLNHLSFRDVNWRMKHFEVLILRDGESFIWFARYGSWNYNIYSKKRSQSNKKIICKLSPVKIAAVLESRETPSSRTKRMAKAFYAACLNFEETQKQSFTEHIKQEILVGFFGAIANAARKTMFVFVHKSDICNSRWIR